MGKRLVAIILIVVMMCMVCSCGSKNKLVLSEFKPKEDSGNKVFSVAETEETVALAYDTEKMQEFQTAIKTEQVEYGYGELFDYEKAMQGMRVEHSVAEHKYSALDADGMLTKEHLCEIVIENNEVYLETAVKSVVKDVDEELILQICEIIVGVVNDMLEKYPDIDKERVYCNLGNLKIVEKVSALNYGAVEPGMVLHINRNTAALLKYNDNASLYNVIVHETMHILQFGCACEQIEGCERRFGPSHAYDDWEQDYADWTWLGEGSAERMACLYIGTEPMTYYNHINYILTLDLVNVLREDVPTNYIESLYFYDDVDKLFYAFDAETEEEKQEVYKMIYSLELMQMEPEDLTDAYEKFYGVAWTEEVSGDVFNKVKRPILKTVTKKFFDNLADVIMTEEISKNDLLFLMNLYESTINQHLHLDNAKYDQYNEEFISWYKEYRKMLFGAFENLSLGEYMAYVAGDGESLINATLSWVPKDKMELLMEKYSVHTCKYMLK